MFQNAICLTILLAGLSIAPSSAQADQLADVVKRVREQLEEGRKELEKARQVYQEALAKTRALEEDVQSLKNKLAKLLQEQEKLKAEREKLLQEREDAKKQEQELKAETAKLEQRLKELRAELDKLKGTPPPEKEARPKIDGTVKEVQESGAIIVSVGSQAGLNKGDTMEVFRFKPTPVYLGRIEITEVKAKEAVARQIGKRRSGVDPIRAGDEVSTRLD